MFMLLRIQYPDGNATIYLMRCLRNDTLKAAGEVVRVTKNSTVSSIIDRSNMRWVGIRALDYVLKN